MVGNITSHLQSRTALPQLRNEKPYSCSPMLDASFEQTPRAPETNYVVGFSGSAASFAAVEEAYVQGQKQGVILHVLNVAKLTSIICPAGDSLPALQNLIGQVEEEALRYHKELTQFLGQDGRSWHFYHRRGSVTHQLNQLASELNAAAIIVGSSGRLVRVAGASVSQQLRRTSKTPLRVVSRQRTSVPGM